MKPKTYAKKLVEKYCKYVNGYVGSSMLTNTEYPETIKQNAKQCALICIDAILDDVGAKYWEKDEITKNYYWKEVKKEIEAL